MVLLISPVIYLFAFFEVICNYLKISYERPCLFLSKTKKASAAAKAFYSYNYNHFISPRSKHQSFFSNKANGITPDSSTFHEIF
jgi:hypothetical protein